ncbi:Ig-like domain-containing protein [Microbacterium sp. PMB16]|uniref:beta-xylosidase family glycoside hydrolase n=1 Tax=Microbacterium sp. PMB16 TaxID=3120157 RepID=UPI003F4C8651
MPAVRAISAFTSLLLAAAMLTATPLQAAAAEQIVDVTTFGADKTGATDSAAAVKAALVHAKGLTGPVRVVFPTGTYSLYPEKAEQRELYMSNTVGANASLRDKRLAILVEKMKDVVIDGKDSKLSLHGFQTAFAAIDSSNVTFQDFSFDYVTPKVIDATVAETGVANGKGYRILQVPTGTLYSVANNQVTWRGENRPGTSTPYWSGVNALTYSQTKDPARNITWRGGNPVFNGISSMTDLGGNRIRIEYTSASRPGDQGIVYQMREDTRDTASAFFWQSRDVTVRNVDAQYLHGFGYLGQLSHNITIEGNNFATPVGSGRSTAGFADFVQMSGVSGTITLRDNVFDGAHDDAINIHGTYLQVVGRSADNKTLTLQYQHHQTAGFPQFYAGDEVEIVAKGSMAPVAGLAPVVVSATGPSGRDHDKNLTQIQVTFDRAIPATVTNNNYVVENTTYTPTVLIEKNTFVNMPTRAILVTTRKPVVIKENVFDGPQMSSIFISSDAAQWYESGPVKDVTIQNNVFKRPTTGWPVIFIEPTNPSIDPAAPVHKNIKILNNEFQMGDGQIVNSKSVQGLTISGNRFLRLDRESIVSVSVADTCPAVGQQFSARAASSASPYGSSAFVLHGDTGVTISNNTYDPGFNRRVDANNGTTAANVTISREDTRIGQSNPAPLPSATYTSANQSVVAVNADGTLRAVAAGTTTIRAQVQTAKGVLQSAPVSVTVGGTSGCVVTPQFGPDWTVVRDIPADRQLTADGGLTLTPGDGWLWADQNTATTVVVRAGGSGTGTGSVKMTGRTNQGWAEAGLLLYKDDRNYIALQRKHNNGTPTITVVTEFNDVPEESRKVADPTAATVWLRLRPVSSGVYAAEYSTDGSAYTQIGSNIAVPAGALSGAHFGVMSEVDGNRAQPAFTFTDFTEDGAVRPFSSTPAPTLNSSWTVTRDNPADRRLTVGGALILNPGDGFLWGSQNNATTVVLRASSPANGTGAVKMTGRTTNRYAESGLLLYGSDNSYIALQRKHNNGNPTITVVTEFNGSPEESRRVADPSASGVWLRLRNVSAGVYAAEYSTDGTTYTQIGSNVTVPSGELANARFGMLSEIDGNNTQGEFTFENFTENGTAVAFR